MSTCDNWVLKNFSPSFVRLWTGTAINALAELIFLIFLFFFKYFLFKPHNKRHTDGVHTPLRTGSLFSSYQLASTAQDRIKNIKSKINKNQKN